MENARKYLPFIIGGVVAVALFFVSRKMHKSDSADQERNSILEKAREAKLAKSLIKNSEQENND